MHGIFGHFYLAEGGGKFNTPSDGQSQLSRAVNVIQLSNDSSYIQGRQA